MRLNVLGPALTGTVLLVGCHTITEELPTQPSSPPSSGVLTVPIPPIPLSNPATTPTPTPDAPPTPDPAPPPPDPNPTPDPEPPDASGCKNPKPPDVSRMKAKVHLKGPRGSTLDSTPLVGPDGAYCAKIGFTDGRVYCPVRAEGAADREACEALAVGRATDTGRPGPTWTRNGKLCTGEDCENHADNQYLLLAYKGGSYEACATNGVCGAVEVD